MSAPLLPRSLVWATDIEKLPVDRIVERRDGYLRVRSPSNPGHYWGNLLLFDDPPRPGDGPRWERLFGAEFGSESGVEHRTFAWDRVNDELGSAREQFVARGYEMEDTVGLIGTPDRICSHPRESREVVVRALDPAAGSDQERWEQVVDLQVAGREEGFEPEEYKSFCRRRLEELRVLFRLGHGAWYVALDGVGDVVGSCGVVVTGDRGRFHAVDTAAAHRRRGICSRLVVEATHRTADRYCARRFVIAAEANYHALGLYESLGFKRTEHVHGVCKRPAAGSSGAPSGSAAAGQTPAAASASSGFG